MSNYSLDLLRKELVKTQDAIDVLNTLEAGTSEDGNSLTSLKNRLANIKYSLKTLEENRGVVLTDSDGGTVAFTSNGGLTISAGKVEIKSKVEMDKYKWDMTEVDKVTEILNNMWKKFKEENCSNKPRTKEDALKYLKEHNEKVKPEHAITRLRYNNGKDCVQDLSFFANPAYMSKGLLEALQKGQTLTGDLEIEFNTFIIEKSV